MMLLSGKRVINQLSYVHATYYAVRSVIKRISRQHRWCGMMARDSLEKKKKTLLLLLKILGISQKLLPHERLINDLFSRSSEFTSHIFINYRYIYSINASNVLTDVRILSLISNNSIYKDNIVNQ